MNYTSTINGITCNPLNLSGSNIKEKKKDNEVYYIITFDGEITFIDSDYTYLVSLGKYEEVEFKLFQDGNLIFTGYFQRQNVKLNIHSRTYSVTPLVKTIYDDILKNYDTNYNIYSLGVTKESKSINTNNVHYDNYSSAFAYPLLTMNVVNMDNAAIGVQYAYSDSNTPKLLFFNSLLPSNYQERGYGINTIEFVVTGTNTIASGDCVYSNFAQADREFLFSYDGYFQLKLARKETYTYDVDGVAVMPSSGGTWYDTTIVDGNGLRTWGQPINTSIGYTITSEFIAESQIPIPNVTEDLNNNLNLKDVINALFNKIGTYTLSSKILTEDNLNTYYADYIAKMDTVGLSSYTYNLTNNILKDIQINTVSNCMNITATEPDANEETNLKTILQLLKELYNIYWKLEGTTIVLEHYSYFDNNDLQAVDINLEEEISIENDDTPDKTNMNFTYSYFNLFSENTIINNLPNVTENVTEININVNLDFASMYFGSKGISEDGFTLINKYGNNSILTQNEDYSLFNLVPTYHLTNQYVQVVDSFGFVNGNTFDTSYNTVSTKDDSKLNAFTHNKSYGYIDINKKINTDYGECSIIESSYNIGDGDYSLILNINDLTL